jgi:hypothetical protein
MTRFLVSIPTIPDWEPAEVNTLDEAASMIAEFEHACTEVTAINPEPGAQVCFTFDAAQKLSASTFDECWEPSGDLLEFLERFDLPSWSEDWANSRPMYGAEHSTLNHFDQGI